MAPFFSDDTDDSPPSSSSPAGDLAPAPSVISLAERRRRRPTRSATEQIRRSLLALVDPGPTAIANDIQIDPEPTSSEPCADLERRELERDLAQEEHKVARGDSTPARLRNLRSLRAMDDLERGARRSGSGDALDACPMGAAVDLWALLSS